MKAYTRNIQFPALRFSGPHVLSKSLTEHLIAMVEGSGRSHASDKSVLAENKMKQILQNLANQMLIQHCLDNKIDCSGTYCVKNGRGFVYSLRDQATGKVEVARVTFHRNQVPTFGWFTK